MGVRITILSGSRQGQTLDFAENAITIGQTAEDSVAFNAATDAGIEGRKALLRNNDGQWTITNLGQFPLFLNQSAFRQNSALHSGDVVRMSLDGPDLVFEEVPTEAMASANAAKPVPNTRERESPDSEVTAGASLATSRTVFERPPAAPPPISNEFATQNTRPQNMQPSGIGLLALIAGVATALLMVSMIGVLGYRYLTPTPAIQNEPENEPEPSVTRPRMVPFGVLKVTEGEALFWRPVLADRTGSERFSVEGDSPPDLTVDPQTGTIRWPTDESDGPGEYRFKIVVTRTQDSQSLTDSQWVEIQVIEDNRPPQLVRLPPQEINLKDSGKLDVIIEAFDLDEPAQRLTYQLLGNVPESARIDSETGRLQWTADQRFANQTISFSIRVSDDGRPSATADGTLRVKVRMPDTWAVVQEKLRASLYLVVAVTKPGRVVVPLGTACSISEHELVTSASVAHGIQDAASRDWETLIVDTRRFDVTDPEGIPLETVKAHAVYVRAQNIDDPRERTLRQAYFDLALIGTQASLPHSAELADAGNNASNNQAVALFGYEIDKDTLSRFDRIEPAFARTTILEIIPPAENNAVQGRAPLLLQLIGDLPVQPFGSIIVNEDAQVLGIYSFRGKLPPNVESEPVHYASEILPVIAYHRGKGQHLWISRKVDAGAQAGQ